MAKDFSPEPYPSFRSRFADPAKRLPEPPRHNGEEDREAFARLAEEERERIRVERLTGQRQEAPVLPPPPPPPPSPPAKPEPEPEPAPQPPAQLCPGCGKREVRHAERCGPCSAKAHFAARPGKKNPLGPKLFCPDCRKPVSRAGARCGSCAAKNRHKPQVTVEPSPIPPAPVSAAPKPQAPAPALCSLIPDYEAIRARLVALNQERERLEREAEALGHLLEAAKLLMREEAGHV